MGCGRRSRTVCMVSSIIFYCVASSVLVWIQQAKKSTKPLVTLTVKDVGRTSKIVKNVISSRHVHSFWKTKIESTSAQAIRKVHTSKRRINVLLFSYYRSGSTLLGSMFNLNSDAFYWFEPLAAPTMKWGWVYDKIPPRNFYHHDNGTEKSIHLDDLRKTLSTPLRLIYDCNITALKPFFFMSPVSSWLSRMRAFAAYNNCLSQSGASRSNGAVAGRSPTALDVWKCLPGLVDICRNRSIVAVKTIRLKMELAEEAMQRDATLRLVYMIRDPRGMLNSWWTNTLIAVKIKNNRYSGVEMEADARLICKRMLSDWKVFSRLRVQYPDRCLQLRYEDLAESPERVVRMVYRFLGYHETPSDVLTGIQEMASANMSDGVFGVRRTNSSATAHKWETQLTLYRLRIITDNCQELLQEFGYQ